MLQSERRFPTEPGSMMTATPANRPAIADDERAPAITQMLASVREDTARLSRHLCYLNCSAAIRGVDGVTLLTIAESSPTLPADATALCASIYDAQGQLCASLDLLAQEIGGCATVGRLLRALLESAAHAIAQRWFRICYRDYWVIAARRHDAPDAPILLAVDRDRRIVGADRAARQFLEVKGRPLESRSSLATLFKLETAPFQEIECDAAHRLLCSDDGVPYSLLITPPDRSPLHSYHDERALLHARPRLDTIREIGTGVPREAASFGLPPRLLRRIEQYINIHLDTPLSIDELAASVGLSVSYFSRSFARSVGTTPHNYVVRRRVLRAQQLLAETDLDLAQIALVTGFADQSHFSRRFRQMVGQPPRAFRQRHR